MKRLFMLKLTALLATAFAIPAFAAWPEMPIRIVVPYAAGGSADNALRQMAPTLQAKLGQAIVIDNVPGAGGNIGAMQVARAKPDGYTLLLGATNNFVINQYIYPTMGFDPLIAFAPITRVLDVPSVIFTNTVIPPKTWKEFAEYAKANTGKLNYGSPGLGTSPHLSAFALSESLGAQMTHVAYKGAPPATIGLIANDIQLFMGSYSAMGPQLASGRVRALAVASATRLPALPNVPTGAEAGMPNVVLSNWWGLAAPKGTDPEVIQKLAMEFKAALATPAVHQFFESQGLVAGGNSPQEFAKQLTSESETWKGIVMRSGTKVD